MMKIKRRTEITTETERVFSVVVRPRPAAFFCAECRAESEMYAINQAAGRIGVAWRKIIDWLDDGSLHAAETALGEVYICGISLTRAVNSGRVETYQLRRK